MHESENNPKEGQPVMNDERVINDSQELLGRLARSDVHSIKENSFVTSPGARATGWTVKIKSLSSYNVYNVRAVVLGDAGSIPVEIGTEMQAINLAESFLSAGSLPAGTYVAMLKIGEKNIFYATV